MGSEKKTIKKGFNMKKIEEFFHLQEKETTLKREILGGITTFLSSMYIVVVIPNVLKNIGMDESAVMCAVCIISGLGSILSGIVSNTPFVLAPGLGLNTIFTYTVCQGYGFTWQEALALVFISGVLYFLLSISPLRERITDVLPLPFKYAICAGVGLFITLTGLINSGLITAENNLLDMGAIISPSPLLALIGIFLTAILLIKKVPGAIIIGMIITALASIPLGITTVPESFFSGFDISKIAFNLNFSGLLSHGFIPIFSSLLSLVVSSFFDSTGTILGVGTDAGLTSNTGDLEGQDKILISNSIATIGGSLFGTSNLVVMAESATGIKEGSRSGLSAVISGLLFLLLLPFAPVAKLISGAAMTAPLVIVGMSMMSGITQITWKHVEISLPCFLIIMGTPFTFSITTGLMLGVISYVVVMISRRRAKLVDPVLYILAFVFIVTLLLEM